MMAQVCLPACCSAKGRLRRAIGERRSPSVVGGLVAESSGSWIWPGGEAGQGALQVRPCKLGRRLLVCAVLRTRQDRGWASCPTRPRHASGPCGSRPCPASPPGLGQISAADPPREINNKSKSGSLRSQSRGRQPPAVAVASAFFLDLPVVVRPPESVWGRAGGVGGVSAAWMPRLSPHGRVYGVPANPTRPAHPQETSFQRPTHPPRRGSAVRRLPPKARFPRKK